MSDAQTFHDETHRRLEAGEIELDPHRIERVGELTPELDIADQEWEQEASAWVADQLDHIREKLRATVRPGFGAASGDELLALRDRAIDRGVSTGWPGIDELYRVAQGQLTVVTGYPNSGKSEWVDALMVNLATEHDWRFVVASLENPTDEHSGKLVEKWAGEAFRQYGATRPRMSETTVRLGAEWVRAHFQLLSNARDEPVVLDWLLDEAGRLCRWANSEGRPINGFVLDPWNELEHERPRDVTETEYIGNALSRLKRFARAHDLHVWVVAHPAKVFTKDGKPRVLGLMDVSGSAHWANKPDMGVVVNRPDPMVPSSDIHIVKVRFKHVGNRGTTSLTWNKSTGRYQDGGYQEAMI